MSCFWFLPRNTLRRSLANTDRYGQNIQRSTTIVAYSREDQEVLVRSIVAAHKSQLDGHGEENSGAFNVSSVDHVPVEKEPTLSSHLSGLSKQNLVTVPPGLNGTVDAQRYVYTDGY